MEIAAEAVGDINAGVDAGGNNGTNRARLRQARHEFQMLALARRAQFSGDEEDIANPRAGARPDSRRTSLAGVAGAFAEHRDADGQSLLRRAEIAAGHRETERATAISHAVEQLDSQAFRAAALQIDSGQRSDRIDMLAWSPRPGGTLVMAGQEDRALRFWAVDAASDEPVRIVPLPEPPSPAR